MKSSKEQLIDRMNELQSLIPDTIEAINTLPEMVGLHLYATSQPGDLTISMPYDMAKYKEFRRLLGKNWKCVRHNFNDLVGAVYVCFYYRHNHLIQLDVQLNVPFSGAIATCKLEIDHTIEKPVYKMVCKE